jgi:pimeloyl-ACP methyl ester carboxylesterase
MNIRRRAFLTACAGGAAAAAAITVQRRAFAQAGAKPKSPIVLVHGAWHGGWCWKRVAPKLRAAGHDVFTPTLTGLGERAHLAGPGVNLETHIADVLNLLEAEELSDVVLVGHSYAGIVITGVADRAAGKVRSLVYLDAFVPESGRSLMDYVPAERREGLIKAAGGAGSLAPFPPEHFGVTVPADRAWVARRTTRHPFATFSQPLHFDADRVGRLPRAYVYCSEPAMGSFDQFAMRLRNDPMWRFHELKTGHDCMITDPESVTRIVLGAE